MQKIFAILKQEFLHLKKFTKGNWKNGYYILHLTDRGVLLVSGFVSSNLSRIWMNRVFQLPILIWSTGGTIAIFMQEATICLSCGLWLRLSWFVCSMYSGLFVMIWWSSIAKPIFWGRFFLKNLLPFPELPWCSTSMMPFG